MKFSDPAEVESVCFQMRQADYPRGKNRALINDLFNGLPPYSEEERQSSGHKINVNSLEGTRIAHDARAQFYSAFLKPGNYFTCRTDGGTIHKRAKYNSVITKEINRVLKDSLPYFECFRSKFALDVLHGIGPAAFRDTDRWCPQPIGIEDVLIPANTLLTMENVPFFAIYRSYTAPELIKLTRGPKVDPGWNTDLVQSCIKWIDTETMSLMGSNWPEVWSPEKTAERVKGDGGFYVGDQVPTIDVWDLYFWNDEDNHAGWNRKMVLDSWSTPSNNADKGVRKSGEPWEGAKRKFLYDPGNRKWGDKLSEIINFQFADLSAVAPFRYHSVRSLGFLLYAVCHLQNRLRCKFAESVFESLLMYFRVKSSDDYQRALKVELMNKGFVDESVNFIPDNERYKVNAQLVELGLRENATLIAQHSGGYTAQNQNSGVDKREKTRFQVMSEVQQMTSLVNSALMQAYHYQVFEYKEIFRRFCKKHSSDPDVRSFRAACLRQDVPESLLKPEAWDIDPVRVMGAGNKTLEMTIAEQLLSMRNLYDPEPQREILRDVTLAITDDPARAEALVPEQPQISDSIHDAQLSFGTLMTGAPVAIKSGVNRQEVIAALLASMSSVVQRIQQSGGMADAKDIVGLQNVGQHIAQHIQILAGDKNEKQRVKQFGDVLGKLMNLVKGFAQRLQEQMQKQNGQGQVDPKDIAKIKATQITADAKSKNTRESHAQKTVQRQIQFEQGLKQKEQEHALELRRKTAETRLDLAASKAKAAIDIRKSRMKSTSEE